MDLNLSPLRGPCRGQENVSRKGLTETHQTPRSRGRGPTVISETDGHAHSDVSHGKAPVTALGWDQEITRQKRTRFLPPRGTRGITHSPRLWGTFVLTSSLVSLCPPRLGVRGAEGVRNTGGEERSQQAVRGG